LSVRRAELAKVEGDISKLNENIAQYKELEETVISLDLGLRAAREILDTENIWTNLFYHLEAATPGDVAFKRIKLTNGVIEAQIEGSSVESLARFIESFNEYKVIVLGGSGKPGQSLKILVDGEEVARSTVKSTGEWVAAINPDPGKDHEIKVVFEDSDKASKETALEEDGGGDIENQPSENVKEESIILKYFAENKSIEGTSSQVRANTQKLFSAVHTNEYKREGGLIKFEVKMNFDGKAIW